MSAVFKSLFELVAEMCQILTGARSVINRDNRIKEIEREIFNIEVPGIEEDKHNLKQDRLKAVGDYRKAFDEKKIELNSNL